MSQPKDRREELCERFAEALRHPADEIYFDEDELVEIFDYAGDLGKTYLQSEALMCGARLYPSSRALSDRRAIFYANNFGDEAAGQYIEDHRGADGSRTFLSDIIALRVNRPEGDAETELALNGLLESVGTMNDEEVVQFVDLAGDLDESEWLLDKLDVLRTKVSFLPTLLYEAAMVATEAGLDARAVPIIEELIEIDDAYSVDYWNMLAQSKLEAGDYKGAMSAIEYARAIDPGNYGAITLYIRVCFESGDPDYAVEGYDFTSRYLEVDPANEAMRQAFISFGLRLGKIAEIAPSVRQLYLANSTSRDHLAQLLTVGETLEGELADLIVASFGETDDTWPMLLRHLCNNGRYGEVVTLGNKFIERYGFTSLDYGPYFFSLF
ncbi:MAG: tetratricopeptide repeat protein, partial [Muribaculaceae bacterium]